MRNGLLVEGGQPFEEEGRVLGCYLPWGTRSIGIEWWTLENMNALWDWLAVLGPHGCGVCGKPIRGVISTNDPARSIADCVRSELLAFGLIEPAEQDGATGESNGAMARRT